MKTIKNISELGNLESIQKDYKFQPYLTNKLDEIQEDFNQSIINEIVLWKVNRYAKLKVEDLESLNSIKSTKKIFDEKQTVEILTKLLGTPGIRLAMASTILRFKAPEVYQIFDQRVYRYLYGEEYKKTTKIEQQISTYIQYLKDLKVKCKEYKIPIKLADRILYQAD